MVKEILDMHMDRTTPEMPEEKFETKPEEVDASDWSEVFQLII